MMPDAVSARVLRGEGPCTRPSSVSISKPVAVALGVKVGDPVQVVGAKTTVAFVESIEDIKDFVVYLGRVVRHNADAHWDEYVQISKLTKSEPAKKVVLGPSEPDQVLDVDVDALKGTLIGYYVTLGDLIEVGRRTFRPIFRDNRLRSIRVSVVETKPSGIVQIVAETDLIVNREFRQLDVKRTSSVAYDDIGGMKDVIEKIREQVEIPLRNPGLFEKLGIEPPKGVLLHGLPGTGKTLLAKAVANESGAYFIGTGASQLVAVGYGEAERRLRELFAEAEQNSPAIIFIDELDTIAPKREESFSPEDKRLVGILLELLDGLKSRGRVIVMAATNRVNAIDSALRRPGRFDREIEIPIPNEEARLEILKIHTRYMPLDEDVDLLKIAENTHGYSGADLRLLCQEAALSCIRRHRSHFNPDGTIPDEILSKLKVTMSDFVEGSKRVTPSCGREIIVEIPKVGLHQVGGYEELKAKIKELVLIPWRNRQLAKKFGIKVPKGILLYGPPGTGKTLIAKALANEAGVKVIVVRGSTLKSKWFGEYESNIRKLFEIARKAAPVVLIIDEVESIASVRSGSLGEASRALDSGVNELLQQLDGVEEIHDVFVVCTTNRPDLIDPAFLRSGRIEYQFHVPKPDFEARKEIFKVHLSGLMVPLGEDVDVEHLTELTDGMVGADIERITRSALLKAFCQHVNNNNNDDSPLQITMSHFLAAIDEVKRGLLNER